LAATVTAAAGLIAELCDAPVNRFRDSNHTCRSAINTPGVEAPVDRRRDTKHTADRASTLRTPINRCRTSNKPETQLTGRRSTDQSLLLVLN
jgi:hypothetical protein